MSPQDTRELESTRAKLKMLEEGYDAARRDSTGDLRLQNLELRSLKRLINQLKEDIARLQAHAPV